MSAEYRLDIHTSDGVKVAEVTDYLDLAYSKRVNAPGLLQFTLPGDHRVIGELEHDGQVIVYRRNVALGLPWTADFWGLLRYQRRYFTDHALYEARAPGLLSLLGRRHVAWKAGTANRSEFTNVAGETLMKTLVSYNAGAGATEANGRVRDGVISGIIVQADAGQGNTISKGCAWQNLLETLQDLAGIAGGDFDLIKVGPVTWEFRFYLGQRGTDRTAELLFTLERGNMAEPVYMYDRIEERTVAIAGGQGEGADRTVTVRTGPDYAADNDIEVFVDARGNETVAGVISSADARLEKTRAREQFSFRVVQTPGCAYGVHYQSGDLVKAQYGPVNVVQKIVGVNIRFDKNGMEQIDVEMETV